MIKFATDEDFNNRILRGLLRRQPELDIVRLQDADLSGPDGAVVLEWAFREQRVLLTHDVSTMAAYAIRAHACWCVDRWSCRGATIHADWQHD